MTIDGKLYTFGDGRYGQLGHGDTESRSMPTNIKLGAESRVAQVSCGAWHTVALAGNAVCRLFALLKPRLSLIEFRYTLHTGQPDASSVLSFDGKESDVPDPLRSPNKGTYRCVMVFIRCDRCANDPNAVCRRR